jgi:hypothetical protein
MRPLYYDYKIGLEKLGRISVTHRANKRFAETIRWKPKNRRQCFGVEGVDERIILKCNLYEKNVVWKCRLASASSKHVLLCEY